MLYVNCEKSLIDYSLKIMILDKSFLYYLKYNTILTRFQIFWLSLRIRKFRFMFSLTAFEAIVINW